MSDEEMAAVAAAAYEHEMSLLGEGAQFTFDCSVSVSSGEAAAAAAVATSNVEVSPPTSLATSRSLSTSMLSHITSLPPGSPLQGHCLPASITRAGGGGGGVQQPAPEQCFAGGEGSAFAPASPAAEGRRKPAAAVRQAKAVGSPGRAARTARRDDVGSPTTTHGLRGKVEGLVDAYLGKALDAQLRKFYHTNVRPQIQVADLLRKRLGALEAKGAGGAVEGPCDALKESHEVLMRRIEALESARDEVPSVSGRVDELFLTVAQAEGSLAVLQVDVGEMKKEKEKEKAKAKEREGMLRKGDGREDLAEQRGKLAKLEAKCDEALTLCAVLTQQVGQLMGQPHGSFRALARVASSHSSHSSHAGTADLQEQLDSVWERVASLSGRFNSFVRVKPSSCAGSAPATPVKVPPHGSGCLHEPSEEVTKLGLQVGELSARVAAIEARSATPPPCATKSESPPDTRSPPVGSFARYETAVRMPEAEAPVTPPLADATLSRTSSPHEGGDDQGLRARLAAVEDYAVEHVAQLHEQLNAATARVAVLEAVAPPPAAAPAKDALAARVAAMERKVSRLAAAGPQPSSGTPDAAEEKAAGLGRRMGKVEEDVRRLRELQAMGKRDTKKEKEKEKEKEMPPGDVPALARLAARVEALEDHASESTTDLLQHLTASAASRTAPPPQALQDQVSALATRLGQLETRPAADAEPRTPPRMTLRELQATPDKRMRGGTTPLRASAHTASGTTPARQSRDSARDAQTRLAVVEERLHQVSDIVHAHLSAETRGRAGDGAPHSVLVQRLGALEAQVAAAPAATAAEYVTLTNQVDGLLGRVRSLEAARPSGAGRVEEGAGAAPRVQRLEDGKGRGVKEKGKGKDTPRDDVDQLAAAVRRVQVESDRRWDVLTLVADKLAAIHTYLFANGAAPCAEEELCVQLRSLSIPRTPGPAGSPAPSTRTPSPRSRRR